MRRPLLRKFALASAAGAGLYVARHMQRKIARAEAGELDEPSIVERPAARAAFGISNAAFGLAYYAALLAAVPFSKARPVKRALLGASSLALAMSLYLMYSLLFRTRMPCPYCWAGHGLNVALFALIVTDTKTAQPLATRAHFALIVTVPTTRRALRAVR